MDIAKWVLPLQRRIAILCVCVCVYQVGLELPANRPPRPTRTWTGGLGTKKSILFRNDFVPARQPDIELRSWEVPKVSGDQIFHFLDQIFRLRD